jgi:hypothetical protein
MPRDFEYRMCPYWVRIRAGKCGSKTRYMYKTFRTYTEAAEYAYSLQSDLTEAYNMSHISPVNN